MNLACLLMTIACLTTIIVYNWNQSPLQATSETMTKLDANRMRAALDAPSEPLVEPIESLPDTSQALVSKSADAPTFDDTDPAPKKCPKCRVNKSRRKSDLPPSSDDEREIEGDSDEKKTTSPSKEIERMFGGDSMNGGFESLLKQIERIAAAAASSTNSQAGNSTGGLSMMSVKPIRDKSGKAAGIVVSANIIENGITRQLNDSTLPLPNFERLFPSILRPALMGSAGSPLISMLMNKHRSPMSQINDDESATANGTAEKLPSGSVATITIGGTDAMPGLLAPLASHLFRSFIPPAGGDLFFARPSFMESQQTPGGAFRTLGAPPMFAGPSPFGPLMSPPPMLPPPGLLSMLLRGSDDDESPLIGSGAGRITIKSSHPATSPTAQPPSSEKTKEPQSAASQLTPSLSAPQPAPAAASSPKSAVPSNNDPEVELLAEQQHSQTSSRGPSFQSIYPRRPPAQGSMLILNSATDSPQATFGPFGLMAPPMMLMGGSHRSPMFQAQGPMNPVLRAILSNVMSELSSDQEQLTRQQQNRTQQQQNRRAFSGQSGGNEMDDEWEASERWDEQQQAQNNNKPKHQLRARHRDLNSLESDLTEADGAAEMMGNFHLNPNDDQQQQLDSQASAMIGGTIRQTIRGPGLSVERIIDMPSGRVQQVASGVKSQSLQLRPSSDSMDMETSANEHQSSQQQSAQHKSPLSLFGVSRPATVDRLDESALTPPVGFIGRLLSDLSRRAAEHQQQAAAQRRENSRSNNGLQFTSLDEDLDEGDSEELAPRFASAGLPSWPRLRLASARIRMGPIGAAEARSSSNGGSHQQPAETFFLPPPPGHFALAASGLGSAIENGELQEFHQHQPRMAASFEDTLNSMEDRLSHVLAVGSKSADEEIPQIPGLRRMPDAANTHPISAALATPTPATTKMSPAPAPTSQPTKHSAKTTHEPKAPVIGDSQKPAPANTDPFTSPDSPLFGFPATSNTAQQLKEKKTSGGGSNRQQRSFTYHSNNELASSFLHQSRPQAPDQQQQHQPDEDTSARAGFVPVLGPPTGAVMGRRLDESFGEESAASEQQMAGVESRQQQQPNAESSNGNQHYWMWP